MPLSFVNATEASAALSKVLKKLGFNSCRELLDTPIQVYLTGDLGYTRPQISVCRIISFSMDSDWLYLSPDSDAVSFVISDPKNLAEKHRKKFRHGHRLSLMRFEYHIASQTWSCSLINYWDHKVISDEFCTFEFIRQ